MMQRSRRRRIGVVITAMVLGLGLMVGPASAHVLVVSPPGADEPHVGWVGGGELPGQGEGLVPGGPTGESMLAPAHAKGLNSACEALRAHGNAAVQIFGPPTPAGCPHGT
jgi:hypothetical protein